MALRGCARREEFFPKCQKVLDSQGWVCIDYTIFDDVSVFGQSVMNRRDVLSIQLKEKLQSHREQDQGNVRSPQVV
jgi:hypothetical protein